MLEFRISFVACIVLVQSLRLYVYHARWNFLDRNIYLKILIKKFPYFYVRISSRPTYCAKSMPIDGIMISELVFEE